MSGLKAVTSYPALVGAVFAQLRDAKNMKQGELAEAVGIGPSTWSRIEKGESSLSMDQFLLASKALDVRASKVLQMAEEAAGEAEKTGIDVDLSWAKGAGPTAAGAAKAGLGLVIPMVGQLLGGLVGTVVANALTKDADQPKQKKK